MHAFYQFITEQEEPERSNVDVLESANRIRKLMDDGDNFGIITAYCPWWGSKMNAKVQKMLEEDVMKLTDGYIPFTAAYSYPEKKKSTKIALPLLFVPAISLPRLIELGTKYRQDTVIYGDQDGVDSYTMDGQKELSLKMSDVIFAFCTVMYNPGTFK